MLSSSTKICQGKNVLSKLNFLFVFYILEVNLELVKLKTQKRWFSFSPMWLPHRKAPKHMEHRWVSDNTWHCISSVNVKFTIWRFRVAQTYALCWNDISFLSVFCLMKSVNLYFCSCYFYCVFHQIYCICNFSKYTLVDEIDNDKIMHLFLLGTIYIDCSEDCSH